METTSAFSQQGDGNCPLFLAKLHIPTNKKCIRKKCDFVHRNTIRMALDCSFQIYKVLL